jgi:hypothetical protein
MNMLGAPKYTVNTTLPVFNRSIFIQRYVQSHQRLHGNQLLRQRRQLTDDSPVNTPRRTFLYREISFFQRLTPHGCGASGRLRRGASGSYSEKVVRS